MRSFKQYAVAAAFAFATAAVGAAPAFAASTGTPDNGYVQPAQAKSRVHAYNNSAARPDYYDVAPGNAYQAPAQDPWAFEASQPRGFQDLH
jgi:hypothetical protein